MNLSSAVVNSRSSAAIALTLTEVNKIIHSTIGDDDQQLAVTYFDLDCFESRRVSWRLWGVPGLVESAFRPRMVQWRTTGRSTRWQLVRLGP